MPRSQVTARQIVHAYRASSFVELQVGDIKQAAEFVRSFTADVIAVQAAPYGAMLGDSASDRMPVEVAECDRHLLKLSAHRSFMDRAEHGVFKKVWVRALDLCEQFVRSD